MFTTDNFIYLDNSATTPLYPEVLDAMLPYLTTSYGNPSSLYQLGKEARKAIEDSREIIASSINAEPEEIFFTSGATESNNWVFYINSDKKTLCTAIEHASVYNQPNANYFSVTEEGFLDKILMQYTLTDNQYQLFSCMLANNEIGTIFPVHDYGSICYENFIKFHVDATQGFITIPIDVKADRIDYLSASAHKIHGPKGIGFLYINKERNQSIPQMLFGGGQEKGLRPGTENVPGIVGFAKAVMIAKQKHDHDTQHLKQLRQYMHYQIMNNISDVVLNGTADFGRRLPNNLNYRFKDIYADELVEMLAEKGIYCSAGSACHSGDAEPSHVLKAIGLTDREAKSSVRFSLGAELEKDDIDRTVKEIVGCVDALRTYG